MLAQSLVPEISMRGHAVVGLRRAELDVLDGRAVARVMEEQRPDVVVQCAAYTDVDRAEADEAGAFAVNAEATLHVARACHTVGALLVYPSTDYVFAGDATAPYGPESPIRPINAYGRSKAAGEKAAREAARSLVVRTSWLYGAGGRNFVDTITRLGRERSELEVVNDQIGRPTWTRSLSAAIVRLAESDAEGVVHWSGGGDPVSWHGVAVEALRVLGLATAVAPVGSEKFARPAQRPAYSVLDCSAAEALLGSPSTDWRSDLRAHLTEQARG